MKNSLFSLPLYLIIGALFSVSMLNSETVTEVQIDDQAAANETASRSCGKPCKVICCPKPCKQCPCPPTPVSACGGIAEYAFICNIESNMAGQVVPQEANILFNTNGLMTSGFSHSTFANQDRLIITKPGTYKVIYHVTQNSEGQWALFLTSIGNSVGTILPSSVFGAKGSDEIIGHTLFCLTAADIANGNNILVLRNHTSTTLVSMLEASSAGLNAASNASILIEQMNCQGQSLC